MDADALYLDAEQHLDDPARWCRLGEALSESAAKSGDLTDRAAAIAAFMHASAIATEGGLVGRLATKLADLGEIDGAFANLLGLGEETASSSDYEVVVRALLEHRRAEDAMTLLERARRLVENEPLLRIQRAAAMAELGAEETALFELSTALRQRSDLPQAHLLRARLLEGMGRSDEALQSMREAARQLPNSSDANLQLGRLYQRSGRFAEAVESLMRAAALAPHDMAIMREVTEALDSLKSASAREGVFAGHLGAFSVWEILELLKNRGSTGRLELTSATSIAQIFLRDGHLIRIASDQAPRLGEVLLSLPSLDVSRVLKAISGLERESDATIARHLLDVGVLDGPILRQAIERQLQVALARMIDWSDGTFAFHQEKIERHPSDVEVDIRFLLLEIVRTRDEAGKQS